jgi:hypothetical protein
MIKEPKELLEVRSAKGGDASSQIQRSSCTGLIKASRLATKENAKPTPNNPEDLVVE